MSTPSEAEKDSKLIEFQLPLVLVRTRKGLAILDRIGGWKVNRILGWIFLLIMPISAAIGLYFILSTVGIYLSNALLRSVARSFTPLANIMIPGLNPLLPLVYGWIALIIGLVAHEGAHGILARTMKLRVKSTGLLLFLAIPIGAFAEVDDREMQKAPPRNAGRVLAAGPGGNILIGLAALAGLILIVSTMTPVASGIGVFGVVEDYPAHQAGIKHGDIIIRFNGQAATFPNILETYASLKPGDTIQFSILRVEGDGLYTERDYTLLLAANPSNESLPYAGFTLVDPEEVLDSYKRLGFNSPLVYLVLPTITTTQQRIPYSDPMSQFYTSPVGPAFQPLVNLLYWIWFVNFNLAIFNALPIYPLDGGQAFKLMIKGVGGNKLSEKNASRLTNSVTLVIIALVLSMIALPYLG